MFHNYNVTSLKICKYHSVCVILSLNDIRIKYQADKKSMPRGKTLTDLEKGQILAFRSQNVSVRECARKICRSQRVVQNFLKDPKTYGQKKRGGRKKILSQRDLAHITRLASNSSSSISTIKAQSGVSASKTTVWRAINAQTNIVRSKLVIVQKLLPRHISARMDFARENMDTNWKKVIYSDEKKWNLDGPDGNRGYWRDLRKEPLTFSKRNFGGASLMVWGAFCFDGTLEIQFVSCRMNSLEYITILEMSLVPFLQRNHHKTFVFQQDNAPIHNSAATRSWLQSKNITVLKWPACSPDLNPMENLWGLLSNRVYAENRQFVDVSSLKNAILEEWDKINSNEIRNLVESMRSRIFNLIQNKGGRISK